MKKTAVCLLIASLLLAGCNYAARIGDQITGSGKRKTESRNVSDFSEIVVEGAYRVEVACGQGPSVEVEADDNILPLIKTEVEQGRLRIRQERGFSVNSLPHVRITVPDVRAVSVPGAADFHLSGVKNDALKIEVAGAAKFRASGETGTLDVDLNGAAVIDARDLRARTVNAVSNGAGMTTVHATEALNATINGVGSIEYYGDPKTVNPKVVGFGKISRK